jgi:hypothetical protein
MKVDKSKRATSETHPCRPLCDTKVAVLKKPASVLKKPSAMKTAKKKMEIRSASSSSEPPPNRPPTYNFLYRKLIINGYVGAHLHDMGSVHAGAVVLEALTALRTMAEPDSEFSMSMPELILGRTRKFVVDRRTNPYGAYELELEIDSTIH